MKHIFTILFLAISLTGICRDTDNDAGNVVSEIDSRYKGSWTGALDVNGSKLELVFNISEKCTLDVPAQGAKGIPADFSQLESGAVKIDVPAIKAYFEGMFVSNMLIGTFYQSGMQFPLTLLYEKPKALNRPQTPAEPFPYDTEEVTFANGNAQLSGTLTTPSGSDMNTPVVIMITGSGSQNRDEELFEHKPFAVIADAFARNGIATLRYDDRGFAKSTGNAESATTDTLAADAAAGIMFLRERGYKNIGALGHSEGGTIVFMLAADGLTDFIISMAGGIERGDKTLFAQVEAQSLAMGANEQQAKMAAQQYVDASKAANIAWMNRFLELDIAPYIQKTKCKVLAINGEKDMQVLSHRNIPLLQELLPAAQVKVYPGLNHMFQHCTTGLPTEYYNIEETISTEVLQDMANWIK